MTLELRDLGKPGESLGEVALGFAEALGADIDQIATDPSTRIHDIRVGTKKIRALLRLAGRIVPAGESRLVAAHLRDIRNVFAGSRDLDVMRHRVTQLFPGESTAVFQELNLASVNPADVSSTGAAPELAAEIRARVAGFKFSALTPKAMAKNAASAYRKARKLLRQCRKNPGDERMHEWRKRTKDVGYHAYALSGVPFLGKLAGPLDALAEALGEYHDLALLGNRAAGHDAIAAVVETRKREVGEECFAAARKIFRRKPGAFQKKLAARLAG